MPMATKKARSFKGKHRVMAQGYADAGASRTKRALRGFDATSGSPSRDIDDSNETIRQRARMLYMSSPIATSAIRTMRTNSIGDGLKPTPRPDRDVLNMTEQDAEAFSKAVLREWNLWASDKNACDATGTNTIYEMQQLAMQSWLLSGDVFALVKKREPTQRRPYALRLHLIEADRVSTPMKASAGMFSGYTQGKNPDNGNVIYDGVEIDGGGQAIAYHIRSGYPADAPMGAETWTRVLAVGKKTGLPNMLHVMESERPDQYRGVSYLAQVVEPLLQIRRYAASELTAAIIESYFTAYVQVEGAFENPWNEVLGGPDGSPNEELSHDPDEYEMGPGQVNFLEPGESVTFADPKRPTSGFDAFTQAMARQIGAALEIPGDVLLKTFNASYSASRAALMEAWKAFRMRRSWFVSDFCEPMWEIWFSEAVARGRINAPGYFADPVIRRAYLGCEWIGPSQGQLDPTKEIAAEVAAVREGLTTREAAAIRLNGSKWDENMDRIAHENARMVELFGQTEAPDTLQALIDLAKEERNNDGETEDATLYE